MYQPIDTTLCAPANVNGRLYPAGTRVRYAVDGNLALVRVVDGPGARMPLALAQTCLAALALATPVAVTLDDLVADHDAAPRTSAAPTTASRPGHGSVPEVNRPLTSSTTTARIRSCVRAPSSALRRWARRVASPGSTGRCRRSASRRSPAVRAATSARS